MPATTQKGQRIRQQIVEAANTLFYRRGYNQTSFSDIARAAGIPRGNFYYHFRSKDDILDAVIEFRLQSIRHMLAEWDETIARPVDRLKRLVAILRNDEQDVLRYGCPMGSLNLELAKTRLELQSRAAAMFELFRVWLRRQFEALGPGERADALALHLLARMQGIAMLGTVYRDADFLRREAARLEHWIDAVEAGDE